MGKIKRTRIIVELDDVDYSNAMDEIMLVAEVGRALPYMYFELCVSLTKSNFEKLMELNGIDSKIEPTTFMGYPLLIRGC